MIKTILLAAAVAASCPETKINLDKTGMPPETLALALSMNFADFIPAGEGYCLQNGFECLTAFDIVYSEEVGDGIIIPQCGHKE